MNPKHYDGKPCVNCQGTIRLKSNNQCVSCRSQYEQRYWKETRKHDHDRKLTNGRRYRSKYRDRLAAKVRYYKATHKEAKRIADYKRRSALTIPYTAKELKARFETFGNQCVYCLSCDRLTVDHFLPLALGGVNAIYNLVPACESCNFSKRDRDPIWWMEQRGLNKNYINALVELILDLAS